MQLNLRLTKDLDVRLRAPGVEQIPISAVMRRLLARAGQGQRPLRYQRDTTGTQVRDRT